MATISHIRLAAATPAAAARARRGFQPQPRLYRLVRSLLRSVGRLLGLDRRYRDWLARQAAAQAAHEEAQSKLEAIEGSVGSISAADILRVMGERPAGPASIQPARLRRRSRSGA